MGYGGVNAFHFPVGVVREIVGSRMNFPLDHATESYKIGFFREAVEYTNDYQLTNGVMGRQYVDLYPFTMKVPDLLLTVGRMKNWYLASKEPNNVRVAILNRGNVTQYMNFVADTGTPSQDGSTETGSSLLAIIPTFTIDNTVSKCELEFTGGLTPGQMIWLANNSTAQKTGGTGGTGSSMTAMTNSRTDRRIAGIYKAKIGGTEINLLTKENCKWEMKGVVPGDRKSYSDQQFVGSYMTTATLEMMGASLTNELIQAIEDEISAAGTMPSVDIYTQGGLTISYEAQTATIVPKLEGGDARGHLTLTVSYEAQFNSNEASPDSIDFDTPDTILFKSLD